MSMQRAVFAVIVLGAAACASGSRQGDVAQSAAGAPARADSTIEMVRRQVMNGSIIADVQLGNSPMAVGACVDPVAAARWEMDRSLEFVPDTPPVVSGLALPPLPASLRESEVRTGVVVAKWVVDTNGTAIPGSVTIASSPHGLMSVQVCGAILTARFTPARDQGRTVRARVEMPVRFVP